MEATTTVQPHSAPVAIIGFFDDEKSFEAAYEILNELEYPPVSITLAMAEKTYHEKYFVRTEIETSPKTDA